MGRRQASVRRINPSPRAFVALGGVGEVPRARSSSGLIGVARGWFEDVGAGAPLLSGIGLESRS